TFDPRSSIFDLRSSILDPRPSILDPQILTWRLLGVARATESGFIPGAVGGNGPAIGRCGVFKFRIISAAADYFQPCADVRRGDFVARVILEVARRPLPHIAAHIQRSERTGAGSVMSGFQEAALFPLPGVSVIRFPFITPGVNTIVGPARG